jgi:vacuolar-type H+-ATPase subunit E/Vma4
VNIVEDTNTIGVNGMTLEALAKDIGAAATAEAQSLLDDASTDVDGIMAAATATVEEYREAQVAKATREAGQVENETVSSARQANQKAILIARREELDATRSTLRTEIEKAGLAGRKGLLSALVKEAAQVAKSAGSSKMVLRPTAIDRTVLEKAGGGFTIGDDVAGIGGFMLESEDGSVSLDYTFEARLESSWKSSLSEVNTILFGE